MAMMKYEYTATVAIAARVENALAYQHGYQDEIEDPKTGEMIPNPETKAQFGDRMCLRWLLENTKAYEVNRDVDVTRIESGQKVDDEVILTSTRQF